MREQHLPKLFPEVEGFYDNLAKDKIIIFGNNP